MHSLDQSNPRCETSLAKRLVSAQKNAHNASFRAAVACKLALRIPLDPSTITSMEESTIPLPTSFVNFSSVWSRHKDLLRRLKATLGFNNGLPPCIYNQQSEASSPMIPSNGSISSFQENSSAESFDRISQLFWPLLQSAREGVNGVGLDRVKGMLNDTILAFEPHDWSDSDEIDHIDEKYTVSTSSKLLESSFSTVIEPHPSFLSLECSTNSHQERENYSVIPSHNRNTLTEFSTIRSYSFPSSSDIQGYGKDEEEEETEEREEKAVEVITNTIIVLS